MHCMHSEQWLATHRGAAGVDKMCACGNKLNLSISVHHRSLRCKYSGRLKRWRPMCPLIHKRRRRPSGEPAAHKMNTPLLAWESSYYNTVSLAAVTLLSHTAQRVARNSLPHLVITCWCATPFIQKLRLGSCEIAVVCIWMISICFVYREVYLKNISEQELLGKVRKVYPRSDLAGAIILSRTWSEDRQGNLLEAFRTAVM